jgi:large subunit ribosomal protein L21
MSYVVIRTGGKQYRVAPGDVVRVERLNGAVGDTITLSDVLMVGGVDGNGDIKVGTPTLPDVKVTAEIVEQGQGKKVIVFKKKRRKSYSRQRGHRQKLTTLKIVDIA